MTTTAARLRRATTAAALAAVVVVLWGTSDTLSSFTRATVTDSRTTVGSGMLAATHSYGSTCTAGLASDDAPVSCPGSLFAPSSTSTGNARVDRITNSGSLRADASYQAVGCAPVSLANHGTDRTQGDLLARNAVTFQPETGPFRGAGSVALSADTRGYLSSVSASRAPTPPTSTRDAERYGMSIWFKAERSTAVRPLFSLSTRPDADAASAVTDRVLYLDTAGRLAFAPTSGGRALTTPDGTRYDTGAWRYVYVEISTARGSDAGTYSASIDVDGTQLASGDQDLGTLAATDGYWHAGWGEVDGAGHYFTGSLSGFTVDDLGDAVRPTGTPTGYRTTDEESWYLDDSGGGFGGSDVTGVYTASTAVYGTDPCSVVSVTAPYFGVTGPTPLRFVVGAGAGAAPFPDVGATDTSTVTLTTGGDAPAVLTGLLLYAPIRARYTTATSTWSVSMIWPDNRFVIA